MSAILYRVWDRVGEEYVEYYPVLIDGKGNIYKFNGFGDNIERVEDRYEVHMSSRREDELGVTMYDGDIVEYDGGLSIIKQSRGGFTVDGLPLNGVSSYGMRVVGNIKENAKILDEAQWR